MELSCITFVAVQVGGTEAKKSPQAHAISMVSDSTTAHVCTSSLQLLISTEILILNTCPDCWSSTQRALCAAGGSCPGDAARQLLWPLCR